MNDEPGALSRWSERKLAARRAAAPAPEEAPPAAPPAQSPAGEPEAPVLPSIDTLDAQSDYTVFLAKNVPETVARAALRKLWTSDPVLANLDGLNHYDDDYNVIDKAISLAQTSYHPERGYFGIGDEQPEAAESPAQPPPPALSDNDAAVEDGGDAPRQETALEPDKVGIDPADELDK